MWTIMGEALDKSFLEKRVWNNLPSHGGLCMDLHDGWENFFYMLSCNIGNRDVGPPLFLRAHIGARFGYTVFFNGE